jgi:hypothetical protein
MTPNRHFYTHLTCGYDNNRGLLNISAASRTGHAIAFEVHTQAPRVLLSTLNKPPSAATSPSNHGKIALARHLKAHAYPVESPFSTLEFRSMTYGNDVRDDTQQLRDIQDLIAKLEDVNRKLALPIRTLSLDQPADTRPADAATA